MADMGEVCTQHHGTIGSCRGRETGEKLLAPLAVLLFCRPRELLAADTSDRVAAISFGETDAARRAAHDAVVQRLDILCARFSLVVVLDTTFKAVLAVATGFYFR